MTQHNRQMTNEELAIEMSRLSEKEANELMDLAVDDVAKIVSIDLSKEELAYRLYRSYVIGYIMGKNNYQK